MIEVQTALRQYRKSLTEPKVNQEHLAQQTGVSVQWYRHLENNPNQPTSYTTATNLLRAINAEREKRNMTVLALNDLELRIV